MSSLRVGLSEEFRRLRERSGHTQQELADAAEISRAHVANHESGRYGYRLDTAVRVAEVLGTSLWRVLRRLEERQ